ncbi:SH2 domain-containing protein 1B [Equus asinus]|uniref:SH2 domain-containing protein 1B n=1 Tax=Equus asinus TaxID=9793 RepID=UPI0038F5DBC8
MTPETNWWSLTEQLHLSHQSEEKEELPQAPLGQLPSPPVSESSLDLGLNFRDTRGLSMDLPYYHGPLSKRDCETLLLKEGVDGNFLLRDSESVPGVLCLCVSFKSFVYTYRIFKEKYGYIIQTVEGARKQIFPNLRELISKFEKPNQGLVVHLSKPIKKTSPRPRWRRSTIKLDDSFGNSNSDYVDVLP